MPTRVKWIVLGAVLGLALVVALAAALVVSPHGMASLADMIGPFRHGLSRGMGYLLGPGSGKCAQG
jgi:hypothetical protein